MINCRSVILPLLLCVMAMPVSAASLDCAKADTQAAVNLCAAKELKDADDELARVSKALSKDLKDPAARAALDQAGKAWDAYRDAECRFESSGVTGAAAEQMVVAYCQAARARTRITVLKRILDCKKGDPTCPVLTR